MSEITFTVERCEDSGVLVASWDEPSGQGGITAQGSEARMRGTYPGASVAEAIKTVSQDIRGLHPAGAGCQ